MGAQTLDARDGEVRVRLSDGSVRAVAAVIGADGVDSTVARHLNGPLERRYAGYTAWRGVADHAIDPELAGETMAPGWRPATCPSAPTTRTGSPPNGLRRDTGTATES
ncbi:hypothetical protein MALV_54820 [Mycolicibacterium alvei]|uniref:FAD-binding domain-containing protein n=1 Tax=Mycolicibacterium alvei TaxID=67081 RepID=A0A6N4V375_9MYCO|nr:hypothetical protein MALV_54820 [Mycolicibacterium alvei]